MLCCGVKPRSGNRVTRWNWLAGESGNSWSSSIRMRKRPSRALASSTAAQTSEGGRSVSRPETLTRRNSASDSIVYSMRVLGGALLALGVPDVHLRVGAVRGGFRVADVDRQPHVGEHRAERREAQHDVVGPAAVAHQAEAPDLALERAEARADLQAELGEQRAPHLLLVDALGAKHGVHLRQLGLLLHQELQAHGFEARLQREVMAHVPGPAVLEAFLADQEQRLVQREERVGRRGVVVG